MTLNSEVIVKTKFSPNADTGFAKTSRIFTVWLVLLSQCDYFSMKISFKYFEQLLSAISAFHKIDIVHRDLKLQNILVTNTFQLKIADFGLSSIVNKQNLQNETMYNVGTKYYRAPELLEDSNDINLN